MWATAAAGVVCLWGGCRPPTAPLAVDLVPINLASRDGRPACLGLYNGDGTPCGDRGPRVALPQTVANRVTAVLNDPRSYGEPEARCFVPEQVLVWPLRDSRSQTVTLSLLCGQVRAEPPLRAQPRSAQRRGLRPEAVRDLAQSVRSAGVRVGVPEW